MPTEANRLDYVIAARDAQFQRVADRVTKRLDRMERSGARTTRRFTKLSDTLRRFPGFPAALGAAAAALSLRALNSRLSESIERVDRLAKRSRNIGLPVETLQLWSQAAREAGVETDAFQRGLLRFQRVLGEAGTGAGEYEEIFERMGVAIRDANGQLRPMEAVLGDVTRAFGSLDIATQQLTIEELFGRGGREMRAFLVDFRAQVQGVEGDFEGVSSATAALAERLQNVRDRASGLLTAALDDALVRLDSMLGITEAIDRTFRSMASFVRGVADAIEGLQAFQSTRLTAQESNRAAQRTDQGLTPTIGPQESVTARDVPRRRAGGRAAPDAPLTRLSHTPDVLTRAYRRQLPTLRDLVAEETRLARIRDVMGPAAEALARIENVAVDTRTRAQAIVAAQIEAEDRLSAARENQQRRMAELQQRLGGFIASFVRGTGSVSQALNSLLDSLIDKVSQSLAGSLLSGVGGSLFSSIGGLFGFQRGGPVQRGRAILVGEGGPEAFVPSTSGRIVPNQALAGGGGGSPVVNLNFQIESTDGPGVRAALREAEPQLTRAALSALAVQQGRPGSVLGRQNRRGG